ncbi:MAG: SDR family NAD(P)-dependent oxidoreductase [Microthrixaceae bacterium]
MTHSDHDPASKLPLAAAKAIDAALEFPVAPSFTRIGYEARRRAFGWVPLSSHDMSGRVAVVTGATSGLGRAAARQLADCGATVVIVGRDAERTERVASQLASHGRGAVEAVFADMGDLDKVRCAAEEIRQRHERVDVLVHNAGALLKERTEAHGGIEATVASQVVGPFLLTCLLLEPLRAAAPGRVITVSSGGMYAAPVEVERLQLPADEYNGSRQYALAKRAQVVLNELLAERIDRSEVVFQAMHPGWADTPGVRESLPGFRRVVGPLLRSPESGADTIVWLAANDSAPLDSTGGFWHDRRQRSPHRLGTTRRSDSPRQRLALWDWVVAEASFDPT